MAHSAQFVFNFILYIGNTLKDVKKTIQFLFKEQNKYFKAFLQ